MSDRKALLVGVENYGKGFTALPAVKKDIQLMANALSVSGYTVERCHENILTDAGKLDRTIRQFCETGGPEDIHIIYFTGHGLLVDNDDCIVPAGTSRKDAVVSSTQRVSTDLSKTVAKSGTGLVLFIIDACRDFEDFSVSKGNTVWGDPDRIARPAEQRFIRFFGCAENQICQVVSSTDDNQPYSLFTKSLAESILEDNSATLDDLLQQVEKRCAEILSNNIDLRPQTPCLS
ncbi:MAG: caspase family protein, partial [Desulfobacterales bacterium]